MPKLSAQYVNTINTASAHADLHDVVQDAIELEHATLPPYLTAMFSLHPEKNDKIRSIIRSVVMQEMLHMTIACNILNSLHGQPKINKKGFIPEFPPGKLPMCVASDLTIELRPYSKNQVKDTFMKIEEPEHPIDFKAAAVAEDEVTIGDFYTALKEKILALGGAKLPGNPDRQVITYFPADQLFPIITKEDAAKAIDVIIKQGEGTSTSPTDGDGELAHYYRFEEIYEGKELVVDPRAPKGYSFTGPDIPFDINAVFNLYPNTKAAMLPEGSEERRNANQLNFVYAKLLNGLHRTFNGEPDFFHNTLGLMFDLKLIAERLCAAPFPGKPGYNVGPPFEYVDINQ